MLIDEISIHIKGGKGGNGAITFHREKYVPKGGPDGGDGGKGGDVYVEGENNPYLLKKFRENALVEAESGDPGAGKKKSGKNAPDLIIKVPFGTRITNIKTGEFVDILTEKDKYELARGGFGGKGNHHFSTATNQTPRFAEKGKLGSEADYKLELRLIADIGLIGLPNAGKSTLLNALTHSQAKVADYPFTTLEPNLGVIGNLVLADIPGLIEGASGGKGLGFQFLRHVERTRLLVHCLSVENEDLKKTYQTIRQEINNYSPELAERPEIILVTKTDLLEPGELKKLQTKVKRIFPEALMMSVLDDEALTTLKARLTDSLPPRTNNTSNTL